MCEVRVLREIRTQREFDTPDELLVRVKDRGSFKVDEGLVAFVDSKTGPREFTAVIVRLTEPVVKESVSDYVSSQKFSPISVREAMSVALHHPCDIANVGFGPVIIVTPSRKDPSQFVGVSSDHTRIGVARLGQKEIPVGTLLMVKRP